MKHITLTYKEAISVEMAEEQLIKKLRGLPGRPEHLAVTHGEEHPHHHVWIQDDSGDALLKSWEGRAVSHKVDVPIERMVEYLRNGKLTSFYSSSFDGGSISESST